MDAIQTSGSNCVSAVNSSCQPSLSFANRQTGEIHENIWPELASGIWRSARLDTFERNALLGRTRRSHQEPVIGDFLPVWDGQVYHNENRTVAESRFTEKSECFLEAARELVSAFDGCSIGVQLSGGVDTSLIIGTLRHLGVPHQLIGVSALSRYEFRTESFVQQLLLDEAGNGTLIDHEEFLPFSNMREIPPHQIPQAGLTGFAVAKAMAAAAQRLDVTVLLTGSGGDMVLGGDARGGCCNWTPSAFQDHWAQDMIYSPCGVHCVAFFADDGVGSAIWKMRRGQHEDLRKKWARTKFREFLPKQLVDYTYKADFWGVYLDGLSTHLEELLTMQQEARELSGLSYFDAGGLHAMVKASKLECEMELNQLIEAMVSAASWACSLLRR